MTIINMSNLFQNITFTHAKFQDIVETDMKKPRQSQVTNGLSSFQRLQETCPSGDFPRNLIQQQMWGDVTYKSCRSWGGLLDRTHAPEDAFTDID